MKTLLNKIIPSPILHAKWLNTLSYLENCGARKIAACEHPTLVKEEMLKHASEEFRHAHYLKSQMEKLSIQYEDYTLPNLLGGYHTLFYLDRLELFASRYSKLKKIPKDSVYFFVTYAIEKRAEILYPEYDKILRENKSKIFVKSIILEEKEHLEEMEKEIRSIPHGDFHIKEISRFESTLFDKWKNEITTQLIQEMRRI